VTDISRRVTRFSCASSIVQFVAVGRLRPGFAAHPGDRLRVEPAEFGSVFRRQPPPCHHRLGAALLQRRIVEIGIGPRRQDFERQRRGLDQIAREDPDVSRFDPAEHPLQPRDIHDFAEAIGDRLAHQRVIRDLARPGQILGARHLVGEDRGDQILGVHPRQRRRHLPAAAKARQGERDPGDPAPARHEHRRVEQRLEQQFADRRRVQVLRCLGEFETVRRGQRQDDVVLGRRRLQLEIELGAKALAQRQAPGAVEPAAIRRMDDQLHAADGVEKALEDDCLLGRQHPERGMPGGEVLDQLAARRLVDDDLLDKPAKRGLFPLGLGRSGVRPSRRPLRGLLRMTVRL
jgi:hypothetical protein